MARVPIDSKRIRESLSNTSDALHKAIKYMENKTGVIELEVPDPYSHEVKRGPASGGKFGCFTSLDPCYDIGVMTGVFAMMKPKAKAKTRRRE